MGLSLEQINYGSYRTSFGQVLNQDCFGLVLDRTISFQIQIKFQTVCFGPRSHHESDSSDQIFGSELTLPDLSRSKYSDLDQQHVDILRIYHMHYFLSNSERKWEKSRSFFLKKKTILSYESLIVTFPSKIGHVKEMMEVLWNNQEFNNNFRER